MDATPHLFHRRALAGRPLRRRPASDSIREQSHSARWRFARGRHRLGGGQSQSSTALRPHRSRTQCLGRRPIFRNQTTSSELGAPESLFHVRASFGTRFSAIAFLASAESRASSDAEFWSATDSDATTSDASSSPRSARPAKIVDVCALAHSRFRKLSIAFWFDPRTAI